MDGWHHQLNGHEFKQAPGDDEGQSSTACCTRWGLKESGMTERLNNNNTNIRPVGRGSFSLKALRGLVIQAVNLSCLPLDGMVSCGLPGENCRNPGPSLGGGIIPSKSVNSHFSLYLQTAWEAYKTRGPGPTPNQQVRIWGDDPIVSFEGSRDDSYVQLRHHSHQSTWASSCINSRGIINQQCIAYIS